MDIYKWKLTGGSMGLLEVYTMVEALIGIGI